MNKILLIFIIISYINVLGQEVLDTIYFVDGKVEAVQLTGMTESLVQYNYYGKGILISISKSRLTKVITRSGRIIIFENTSKKKTVFSAEDWEKVGITNIEC